MTYIGDSMLGSAICEWFEGKKKHSDSFHHASLKRPSGRGAGAMFV